MSRQSPLHLGVAHHLGWAVAVTADADHHVVDRRRIELVEPGLPVAPYHHEGGTHEMHRTGEVLDDVALARLAAEVRASISRTTTASIDGLIEDLGAAPASIALRSWPDTVPSDVATLRRPPWESRIDSIVYCLVLADVAVGRGMVVRRYDAKSVEGEAAALLGDRADDVLRGPRARLGPPWAKDHRLALAATIVGARA